jgi:hypothetical protein
MGVLENKKINNFKRLLKELGIYSLWLTERKYYSRITYKSITLKTIFYPVTNYWLFGDIINYSFSWETTSHPQMWEDIFYSVGRMTAEDVLANETSLERLKETINKFNKI